jgi:hypothetical protein
MKFNRFITAAGLALTAAASMIAGTATAASQDTPGTSIVGSQHAGTKAGYSTVGYYITIHTANVDYAGTDGDVWLRVHGRNASTQYWKLDDDRDNYEQNDTDRFLRSGVDVGSIRCVTIAFNPLGGSSAEWLPDRITVNGTSFRNTEWFMKGRKNDFQYRSLCA